MSYISIDVDYDDIISNMGSYDKQAMVDELYDDGYVASKDKRSDYDDPKTEFDEACIKLFGNGWRLSKEDEETILKIANKVIS
jgi:hypothetical protein